MMPLPGLDSCIYCNRRIGRASTRVDVDFHKRPLGADFQIVVVGVAALGDQHVVD